MEINTMNNCQTNVFEHHPQCLPLTQLFDMHDLDERWIILIYGLSQTEVRPFPVIMLFIIHRSRVRIPGTTLRFACSGVHIRSFFASLSYTFHIQSFLLSLFLLCLPRTSVACSFQGMITFQSHMRIQLKMRFAQLSWKTLEKCLVWQNWCQWRQTLSRNEIAS